MNPFDLPDDAARFLGASQQLRYDPADCEPGLVRLKSLNELALGAVWVDADQAGSPFLGNDGHFLIPAVSLTRDCESYEPEFILLWLPIERMFGTWDSDHLLLTVFGGTSWSDIEKNPAAYLNAQWNAAQPLGSNFAAWETYEFISGYPW